MTPEAIKRLEREHQAAVEGLRDVRDTSISHDDAIHIAEEALRHTGVIPMPKFEEMIQDLVEKQTRLTLGDGVRLLALGEGVTQQMLTGPIPRRLLDDLRCASCERNGGEGVGPAGLCDGCLEA